MMSMTSWLAVAAMAMFLPHLAASGAGHLAGSAAAGVRSDRTETIEGELVDEECYLKDHKNAGASHRECAETCARKGQPVALVTAAGKVYQIAGALAADNNAKLLPHLSHTVEITGDVTEKDGRMTIAADAGSLKMVSR